MFKHLLCILSLIFSLGSFASDEVIADVHKSNLKIDQHLHEVRMRAALSMMEEEAIKALLFTSILASQKKDLVQIPYQVEENYQNTKRAFFGAPWVAGSAFALVKGSMNVSNYLMTFASVQKFVYGVGGFINSIQASGIRSAKRVYLYQLFQVGKAFANIPFQFIKRMAAPLSTRKARMSSAGTIGTLYLSSSLYLSLRGFEDVILDHQQFRDMFSYDSEMMKYITREVQRLSNIFQLTYEEEEKFKALLIEKVIAIAFETRFQGDGITLDTLQILKDSKVLKEEEEAFVESVQALYTLALKDSHSPEEEASFEQRLYDLLALAALMQEIQESKFNDLSDKQSEELDRIVLSIRKTVEKAIELTFDN